jgi:integrase
MARVADLVDGYLAARRVGPTQRRALDRVRLHLGGYRVDQLTPVVLGGYETRLAPGTRRRELGALQTVLHWAQRTRTIAPGSAPAVDLPPPAQPRQLWLDRQDAQEFHDNAVAWDRFERRVGVFVSLALNTGARREAIEDLTWDRVDLNAGTIDYREPGRVLSKKRRVMVPINRRLANVLQAIGRVDNSPYVCGQCSIRYPYETFTHLVGVPWVTPHVLRHTAATLMLQDGVSLWDVAGVLGDAPATVSRVYGHHSATHLRAAVGALG